MRDDLEVLPHDKFAKNSSYEEHLTSNLDDELRIGMMETCHFHS